MKLQQVVWPSGENDAKSECPENKIQNRLAYSIIATHKMKLKLILQNVLQILNLLHTLSLLRSSWSAASEITFQNSHLTQQLYPDFARKRKKENVNVMGNVGTTLQRRHQNSHPFPSICHIPFSFSLDSLKWPLKKCDTAVKGKQEGNWDLQWPLSSLLSICMSCLFNYLPLVEK